MTTLKFAKQIAKKVYITLDPINVSAYRWLRGYRGPIPSAANRIRIGCISISKFRRSGWNSYEPIQNALQKYYGRKNGRVLDFGCGPGRILQFLVGSGFELHGTDVDSSAIDFVLSTFPTVQAKTNKFTPPLEYPSAYFDIIYSVSIWTHLPPAMQEPWLREIRRILKPGGIALLTTIGAYGYRKGTHLSDVTFSLDDLLKTGFQHSVYANPNASPGTDLSYGAAYHTPDYVRKEWGRIFDVLEIQEGVVDDLNDLVILV